MKIQIIVDFDLDNGEYELTYKNVSKPGTPMDAQILAKVLQKVGGAFKDSVSKPIEITPAKKISKLD